MAVKKAFKPAPIGRSVQSRNCPRCHASVLAGYDEPPCALLWMVDLQPLTPHGEVAALLTGRRTFRLQHRGDHHELQTRTATLIRTQPAATDDLGQFIDIRPEHRCGQPITHTTAPPVPDREDPDAPPPF